MIENSLLGWISCNSNSLSISICCCVWPGPFIMWFWISVNYHSALMLWKKLVCPIFYLLLGDWGACCSNNCASLLLLLEQCYLAYHRMIHLPTYKLLTSPFCLCVLLVGPEQEELFLSRLSEHNPLNETKLNLKEISLMSYV